MFDLDTLIVTARMLFANLTIPMRWLSVVDERFIRVHRLVVDMQHVSHMHGYAFATEAFSASTRILILQNLRSTSLTSQSLYGLFALAELRIDSQSPLFIPTCLCGVSQTVTALHIRGPNADVPSSINGLTATILSRLQLMELEFNMRDTIDEYSFLGMSSVQELRMAGCQIEVIGPNAFYPVRRTLRRLLLNGNHLSRLPMGVFSALLPNPQLAMIAIHDNPWQCDCRLYDLQMTLTMNAHNFEQDPLCGSPTAYANRSVMSSAYCTVISSSTAQTPVNEQITHVSVVCADLSRLKLAKKFGHFKIAMHNASRTVSVLIETNWHPYQLYIQRTYGSILNSSQLHRYFVRCDLQPQSIYTVGHVCTDVVQMFCVILATDQQISPFNCVSQRNKQVAASVSTNVWIVQHWRCTIMSLVFAVCLLTIVVGCALGWAIASVIPKIRIVDAGSNNSYGDGKHSDLANDRKSNVG